VLHLAQLTARVGCNIFILRGHLRIIIPEPAFKPSSLIRWINGKIPYKSKAVQANDMLQFSSKLKGLSRNR